MRDNRRRPNHGRRTDDSLGPSRDAAKIERAALPVLEAAARHHLHQGEREARKREGDAGLGIAEEGGGVRFEWMVLPTVFLYVAVETAASSHAGEAWVEPGTRRGAVAEAGAIFCY